MIKIDSPVAVENLLFLPCGMQNHLFNFELLEVDNHRSGLRFSRRFGTERSVASLNSKIHISKGFQLFFNKVLYELEDIVSLSSLRDPVNANIVTP